MSLLEHSTFLLVVCFHLLPLIISEGEGVAAKSQNRRSG